MQHVQNSEASLESKKKHCMNLDWFTPLGNQEADIVLERYGRCQGISECVGLAQRADEDVTLYEITLRVALALQNQARACWIMQGCS